jgi:hypothetical protein
MGSVSYKMFQLIETGSDKFEPIRHVCQVPCRGCEGNFVSVKAKQVQPRIGLQHRTRMACSPKSCIHVEASGDVAEQVHDAIEQDRLVYEVIGHNCSGRAGGQPPDHATTAGMSPRSIRIGAGGVQGQPSR